MFTEFYSETSGTLYRPTAEMADNLKHDGIAFCAGCTQFHDDKGPDTYRALCADCGKRQVFGHLNFHKII